MTRNNEITVIVLDEKGKETRTTHVQKKDLQYAFQIPGAKPGIGLVIIKNKTITQYRLIQSTSNRTGKTRLLWETISEQKLGETQG